MTGTQRRDDEFPLWLRLWMWATLVVLTIGAVIGYQILQALADLVARTGGAR